MCLVNMTTAPQHRTCVRHCVFGNKWSSFSVQMLGIILSHLFLSQFTCLGTLHFHHSPTKFNYSFENYILTVDCVLVMSSDKWLVSYPSRKWLHVGVMKCVCVCVCVCVCMRALTRTHACAGMHVCMHTNSALCEKIGILFFTNEKPGHLMFGWVGGGGQG
jgi:hypothetical protein